MCRGDLTNQVLACRATVRCRTVEHITRLPQFPQRLLVHFARLAAGDDRPEHHLPLRGEYMRQLVRRTTYTRRERVRPDDTVPRYPRSEQFEQLVCSFEQVDGAQVPRVERPQVLAPHGIHRVVDQGAFKETSVEVDQGYVRACQSTTHTPTERRPKRTGIDVEVRHEAHHGLAERRIVWQLPLRELGERHVPYPPVQIADVRVPRRLGGQSAHDDAEEALLRPAHFPCSNYTQMISELPLKHNATHHSQLG